MKKVLSFALSLVLVIAMVVTSMVFASASQTHTVTDLNGLKTALSSAQDGDIINITGEIKDAESLEIKTDVTLTGTGSIAFSGDGFVVTDGAKVVVEGGTYTAPNETKDTNLFKVVKGATEPSSLVVDGGNFEGGFTAKDGIDSEHPNLLTINDGAFKQKTNILVNMDCAYTVTEVNGGTFNAESSASAPMLKINNANAVGHINGGNFTQNAKQLIISLNNNAGFTVGKSDGTGPRMTQNGNTCLMQTASAITTTADMTIYGGEFLVDKKWGYQVDLMHAVDCKFEIAGGTFTNTAVVKGDMVRSNHQGVKNLVISGGEFHQHAGEDGTALDNAIVQIQYGSVTIAGGTYTLYGPNNVGSIIWTKANRPDGSLVFEGDKVVFNNMSQKCPSIMYQSGCPVEFKNFKYTSSNENDMPLFTAKVTSSSPLNDIRLTNCEINTVTTPFSFTGPTKVNLVLDDATKIITKSYAFDNQNDSNVIVNNAKITSKKLINFKGNSNGSLTMFVTAQPEQVYVYTYTRVYTEDGGEIVPYIEAIMENGSIQKIEPLKILEDQNNLKSVTVKFKTPAGISKEKNLRIGVAAGATPVTVSMDSFSVKPTDKFDMVTDVELVDTEKINSTSKLVNYDANADECVLMIDGDFNASNIEIVSVGGVTFEIRESKIMLFRGENTSNDKFTPVGGGGYIYQDVTLQPGKTYRLTGNVKYASDGLDTIQNQKKGFIVYYKKSSSFVDLETTKLPEDLTEYKEEYIFTVPTDVANSEKNVRISFNFSNAYITGYASDFSLVEVDATNTSVLSKELLTDGNFGTGTTNHWQVSGTYYSINFCDYVDNFFNKITPHTPSMMQYSNSVDYAQHYTQVMLKPNTSYEVLSQQKHVVYNKDKKPYLAVYQAVYNEDRSSSSFTFLVDYSDYSDPNVTYEELENNWIRIGIKTPDNLRVHGDSNHFFRYYSRSGSAGYFGELLVYELDENGNRVGDSIVVNGDFSFDSTCWHVMNEKKFTMLEQVPGFMNSIVEPETMIYADGTGANQNYSATVSVDASKQYTFSGYSINMNSEGVSPRILYQSRKANGAYEVLETTTYYDSDIYYFEVNFEIPEDAVVKNGEAIIKVQMNNGKNGKGYFRELRLSESDKFASLITTMSGGSTFKEMPYDSGVFIFYYDDTKFDDGDWSGELSASSATTGAVSGRVVNSKDEALSNVTIMIGDISVKTDENGNYSAANLKPGNYDIYLVEANGNKLLCYTVEVKAGILSNIPIITYLNASELTVELPEEDDTDSDNNATVEQTPYGALRGYYLDQNGKPIKGAKIYLKGLGFVTTNDKGMFEFSKLPVGEYEVYTKLADGSTHVFRKVNIEAFKGALIKVVEPVTDGGFNWLWVIIPSAVVVLAGAAFVTILVIKKKKVK